MFWKKEDRRKISIGALDAIKEFEKEKIRNGSRYNNDEIKELIKYQKKISRRMDDLEKYGIDWYDAYKLKRWTRKMLTIMDRIQLRDLCQSYDVM